MKSSPNNPTEDSKSLQRFLIGGGTLLVVILTLIGAVMLAMQDMPPDNKTPVAQATTTPPAAVNTPVLLPTLTFTPAPPAVTTTLVAPATVTPVAPLPVEVSPTAAPATFTPAPLPATDTPAAPPAPSNTPVPPAATKAPVTTAGGTCQPPASWIVYPTQLGDTLNSLATRTGVTVFDLQQANCLASYTIQPGQNIYLPMVPPTPTFTPVPQATGTRLPTPTRTATPVSPKIGTALVQTDVSANVVAVFVTGENFRPQEQGFRAELIGPTTVQLQIGGAATSTSFEGRASLDKLALGNYDLVVINPDGRMDTRTQVWPPSDTTPTPTPAPPEITRVSPSSGYRTQDVRLTVQGRNFRPLEAGFRTELQLTDGSFNVDLTIDESVRSATSTSYDVLIPAGTLETGSYDLLVTNPNGQTAIQRFAYEALN